MSDGEFFLLAASVGAGLITWSLWYRDALFAARRCSGFGVRWPLAVAPVLCGFLLFQILHRFASFDVRDNPFWMFYYMAVGAAWVGLGTKLSPFFGLSARDDVAERGNGAAAVALAGFLIGLTLCFAGANIGDGPGWWVVIFCAFLSSGTLLVLWMWIARAGAVDTITIDRDPSSGWRAAGFFVGAGAILGRSVAGDWVSAAMTAQDFLLRGWPALVLALAAAWLERRLRPTPEAVTRPLVSHGILPSLLYAAAGVLAVIQLGWWER
jgi:uncharacterized membrane protein YjfL (UPF0719 family)